MAAKKKTDEAESPAIAPTPPPADLNPESPPQVEPDETAETAPEQTAEIEPVEPEETAEIESEQTAEVEPILVVPSDAQVVVRLTGAPTAMLGGQAMLRGEARRVPYAIFLEARANHAGKFMVKYPGSNEFVPA